MRRTAWLLLMPTLLLLSILGEVIRPADASAIIYIRSNGSVDPADTAILNISNVTYIFTENIGGRIVVERDSIVVDGADYSLEGTGSFYGIDLSERNNVTIRNTKITGFVRGIYLYKSSAINIHDNDITGNSNGIVLYRSSNQNTITGNNITESDYDGISSSESSNNSICGNIVTGSDYGIYLDYSSHNNVSANHVTQNKHGISIFLSSNNNTIQENTATENQEGMSLSLSSNNVLRLNTMTKNEFNIRVWGSNRSHFNNDVDPSNTVDGKSIYYWIDKRDLTVPLDAGFVTLINCTGITVRDLNLTKNQEGVLLAYTMNSTITMNNITHNAYGIWLHESCNNTITRNNITNNDTGFTLFNGSANNRISENRMINNYYGIYVNQSSYNTVFLNNLTSDAYGIWLHESYNNTITRNNITGNQHDGIGSFQSSDNNLYGNNIAGNNRGASFDGSSNNMIFHNNFVDNLVQVYCHDSANIWDDGYPSGGNYWSDYDGSDSYCGLGQNETGRDGIGDDPYVIDESNLDNYPLMKPYPSYPIITILSPENTTYLVDSVPLTFTVDESPSWMGYSVDGHANVTTLGNTTLSGLLDGTYTLVVYANDTAGNMGTSSTVYFTVRNQQVEPLQLWIVLIIAIAGGAVVIFLIYFVRIKKAAKKAKEDNSEASPSRAHLGHTT